MPDETEPTTVEGDGTGRHTSTDPAVADSPTVVDYGETGTGPVVQVTEPPTGKVDLSHIGDTDVVFMSHPDTAGCGSSLGKAFREVWAPKGWYQVTQAEFQLHADNLAEQANAFTQGGIATPASPTLPAGETPAADVVNNDRATARHR